MNGPFPLLLTAGLIVLSTTAVSPLAADDSKAGATASGAASQQLAEEIGSLRNARVAIPMSGQKTIVTYFSWNLPDSELRELVRLSPNVRIVNGLTPAEALERAAEAHGADARYLSPEFLARAKHLVWVQTISAGVDRYVAMTPLVENDAIVLTNSRGVYGPAIADHALAMLLSLTRGLTLSARDESTSRSVPDSLAPRLSTLEGKTMLVVGIGGIGTEIAKRAHGFGMRVIGTRRSAAPGPDYIERVGTPDDLLTMLPEADVVAIAVPLTPETEKLFNSGAFAAMKPESYLINIARGRIVDTEALTAALQSGKLAGACLDVTDPEPLPADHPLRTLPNVIITPHVAGISEYTNERNAALLRENLRRFGAGEPLLNVVDKRAGY